MSSKSAPTIGYKYYLGAHMIFCHGPVDAVTEIRVDDKVAWSGTNTGGSITIDQPELFGEVEGGVQGTVNVAMGAPTQAVNDYLASQLDAPVPAFRGVLGLILRQIYVGNNPYLKRWQIRARRILTRTDGSSQWNPTRAAIGQDMNPIHIIRECLTDKTWGMGYPEADIDDTSFTAAALTLFNENFGLSMLWSESMQISDFIGTVLDHIDGSLYVRRTDGKFVIKLARADYTVSALPLFNQDNVSQITNFKRKSVSELTNQITVTFWDQAFGKESSVTVQDIALVQQQGTTVGTTNSYPGITNGTLAARVAARDLKVFSTPLASCTIYTNRDGAGLNVGDVFRLSWPRYNLDQIVMRISNIELGGLDANQVKIDCVEDVFALGDVIYAAPPPSDWVNPIQAPVASPHHAVIESPYYEIAKDFGDAFAQGLDPAAGYIAATCVRPTSASINALLYNRPASTFERAGFCDFCPTATLGDAVSITATTMPLTSGIDLDLVTTGTYALLGTEIIRIDSISSSSMTVGRGCLDSVPVAHASGARVFFVQGFFGTDRVEYGTGESVQIRLCPVTGLGSLPVANAPTQTVTMAARQARPYPPGRLRINTLTYPDSITGACTVSWAHRDRLQQTASVIDTTATNIGPEAGTTYTVRFYQPVNTLLSTQSGITTTTSTAYTFPGFGPSRVTVTAVRDGLDSRQALSHTFEVLDAQPDLIANSGTTYDVATTQDQTIPATAQEDDLLLAFVMHSDTLTPPAGWVLVDSETVTTTVTQYTSVYKRIAQSGDGGTTQTWTQATSQRIAVHYHVYRKTGGCDVLQTNKVTNTSTVSTSVPPLTATGITQRGIFACSWVTALTTSTISTTFGVLTTPVSLANNRLGVAHKSLASTETLSGAMASNTATTGSVGVSLIIG